MDTNTEQLSVIADSWKHRDAPMFDVRQGNAREIPA